LIGEAVSEQAQTELTEQTCWHCGADAPDHFCPSCHRIQSLRSGLDYFSFFSLPRGFNVDTAQLERRFYDLSRKFHPDFFFNASESERQYSMERSSMLNDAYRTLKDPIKRARYLLELEGRKIGENKGKVPPDLLSEVFELNEEMEELRAAKQAQARDQVEQLKNRLLDMEMMLKDRASQLQRRLREAFDRWESLPAGTTDRSAALNEANEQLMQMSYINNLIDDIEEEL
jgi:molecular chaperone HscB